MKLKQFMSYPSKYMYYILNTRNNVSKYYIPRYMKWKDFFFYKTFSSKSRESYFPVFCDSFSVPLLLINVLEPF